MVKGPKKALVLGLTACVAAMAVCTATAANADGLTTKETLQPLALNHASINALRELDPSLTGSGVAIAFVCRSLTYINGEPQNDYRPSTKHHCFKGKRFSFHDGGKVAPGVSPHSTAICSILVGEDPEGFNPELGQFYYQGVAPAAEADIYEFWHFIKNNVIPCLPPDADIITASIGSESEYWWTRGLESLVEQYGLIVVAGIGNGLNVGDPLLYPGAGANVIGVGVVDSVNTENLATSLAHFALAYPEHSSFGPTADGRCKPDIVAPGNCLAADDSEPNRYEATGNWSSFSTPIIAGAIGLLVQKAKQEPDLSLAVSPNGGNCVIKAILMNSAIKLPYWHKGGPQKDDDHGAPLDYIQGAGMLNAAGAYKNFIGGLNKPGDVSNTGWDLNYVHGSKKRENGYRLTVTDPADKLITVTAVWNKRYDSIYPFEPRPDKDANLRLEVWAVDPNNPDNEALLDYSDSSVDNVEHIYRPADANYSNYEIVVSFSDNIGDSNQSDTMQRYGIAWNVADRRDGDDSIFWYDLNADGAVNESDLIVFVNNWLTSIRSPGSYCLGDIDSSGVFDANDFGILSKHMNLEAEWHTE